MFNPSLILPVLTLPPCKINKFSLTPLFIAITFDRNLSWTFFHTFVYTLAQKVFSHYISSNFSLHRQICGKYFKNKCDIMKHKKIHFLVFCFVGQIFCDWQTHLHLFYWVSHAIRKGRSNFLLVYSGILNIIWTTLSCS